eukprot:TRINITY_DN1666_c1_g1_i7.p1 TRINITY_DN1666_c1_g1~~TRINITY_DN1666_c1_g1_i7.p1  ORF type:complete len:210 (+),score=-26.40 TRINITY_DN1666_c1_g1_i7:169-798(+)
MQQLQNNYKTYYQHTPQKTKKAKTQNTTTYSNNKYLCKRISYLCVNFYMKLHVSKFNQVQKQSNSTRSNSSEHSTFQNSTRSKSSKIRLGLTIVTTIPNFYFSNIKNTITYLYTLLIQIYIQIKMQLQFVKIQSEILLTNYQNFYVNLPTVTIKSFANRLNTLFQHKRIHKIDQIYFQNYFEHTLFFQSTGTQMLYKQEYTIYLQHKNN